MVVFPFTKKKFESLSVNSRHKWIIKWLSRIYQELAANRFNEKSFIFFFENYSNVLQWMGDTPCSIPDNPDTKNLIEFVSDSIHRHRIKAGLCPKDHDLLVQVMSADRECPEKHLPVFHYHIALDGLRSLFNTGSIFRTCDAAGFQSIILGNTPGPEHPVIRKTSMGAAKWVPFTKTDDLASDLDAMKQKGFKITGIETVKGSESYTDYNWQGKGVVVFGNEEYGISSHVMRTCDDFVHIPMYGIKNSINVANAVSIIAFHIASIL